MVTTEEIPADDNKKKKNEKGTKGFNYKKGEKKKRRRSL